MDEETEAQRGEGAYPGPGAGKIWGQRFEESEVHTLLMVSLEESLRLFGSSCHKKSSHLLGLLSLRRVKTKNANEDSGIAKSS